MTLNHTSFPFLPYASCFQIQWKELNRDPTEFLPFPHKRRRRVQRLLIEIKSSESGLKFNPKSFPFKHTLFAESTCWLVPFHHPFLLWFHQSTKSDGIELSEVHEKGLYQSRTALSFISVLVVFPFALPFLLFIFSILCICHHWRRIPVPLSLIIAEPVPGQSVPDWKGEVKERIFRIYLLVGPSSNNPFLCHENHH